MGWPYCTASTDNRWPLESGNSQKETVDSQNVERPQTTLPIKATGSLVKERKNHSLTANTEDTTTKNTTEM